ncbi:triosephosphate isomerase [Spiroplasma sabaudiense Ar-1343]|uniref:Triosephosphate isomerase n=1 Tax=Spiroplasma sabaudiense Ar-1343 TaxID=1276257 RepID=W6A948_9MOLU|nr:triose-phosphate isomerase [Spiroplasma sabaudiense]AHI53537.1 triosephosphate isomerase [Spiroplasma sabaudiense Ar-1343]
MRKQIIIGNWKMYKTNSEALNFIKEVDSKIVKNSNLIAGIGVPFTALSDAKKAAKNLVIAAENVHFEKEGAYTGEISIPMLKDLNVEYVIIGHSERREMFNETDETVNKKALALLANNMIPVLCCGESLEIFEAKKTKEWVENQITKGFNQISAADAKKVVIAYEPIWAIGTGKVATPEIAQEICKIVREKIASLYNQDVANEILIQYGGSVKPENIKEILNQADIDGALVGGASLIPDSYLGLVNFK